MGTRHLIAVQIDGKYPVAQYGQWDGYPDGQGVRVLRFLRDEMREETFIRKVRAVREVDDKWKLDQFIFSGVKRLEDVTDEMSQRYFASNPQLSRDAGSKVLAMIQSGDEGLPIETEITFAGESLMCEWAWVIDFDKRTFEAFKGVNTKPLDPGERFTDQPVSDSEFGGRNGEPKYKYYQVRKVAEWPLESLPTDEEFLAEFERQADAGEAASNEAA